MFELNYRNLFFSRDIQRGAAAAAAYHVASLAKRRVASDICDTLYIVYELVYVKRELRRSVGTSRSEIVEAFVSI
jgi:hypothetical protein